MSTQSTHSEPSSVKPRIRWVRCMRSPRSPRENAITLRPSAGSENRVDEDGGVGAGGEREAEHADGPSGGGRISIAASPGLSSTARRAPGSSRPARAKSSRVAPTEAIASSSSARAGVPGRRLDLAPAGERPGGDHLAAIDARLIDRRIGGDEQAAAVGLLQDVARADLGERPRGGAQLERAVEDGRLQRREQQPAPPLVALAPLAPQERQPDGGVVAAGAEALRAEPVGDAGRRQRREARLATPPRSTSVASPVSVTSNRLPRRCPSRSLCGCGAAARTLRSALGDLQRARRRRRPATLSHWRVSAWRSLRPA